MADYYLWIRAFHLIAVISWMAAMLYLPRLYVYHADAAIGSDLDNTLQTMEKRLLRAIMTPAMVVSLVLGLVLVKIIGVEGLGGWFHAKMALLLGMFALHGIFSAYRKKFERGENTKPANYFRVLNEVVTFLMVAIVILAVVKPF